MMHTSFLFVGNRRFSYLREKSALADLGYRPLLRFLRERPELRAEFSSSASTTLWLRDAFPDVIDGVRAGLEEGRFGISTNGYEHVFLPTLSLFTQEKLIEYGVAADREIYGRQPGGFWASDCCWDSTVLRPLADNGVRWVFADDWIATSNPGGPFYPDARAFDPYEALTVRGPEEAALPGFFALYNSWPFKNYYMLLEKYDRQYHEFLEALRERASQKEDGFCLLAFDFELLAVFHSDQWRDAPHKPFERLADDLSAIPNLRFSLPDEYLAAHPPRQSVCLRENPGCDWLKPWDAGCRKLDDTCRQAENLLIDIEDELAAKPALATPARRERLDALWRRLLLGFQSEPRMTHFSFMWDATDGKNQCRDQCLIYPPDEMVLEAMNDAAAALRGARDLKRDILRGVTAA